MKLLKNNLKVIIAFILGLILAGGIVYAAVASADEVSYTTNKNAEIKNVAEALNDLYTKSHNGFTIVDYNSGAVTKLGSVTNWYTENISIPSGVKDIIIYAHTMSDYGIPDININGDIIVSNDKNRKYTFANGGNYAAGMYIFNIKTSGEEGILNAESTIEAKWPNNTFHHAATLIVAYK